MDIQALASAFLSSSHGQGALDALGQQGVEGDHAAMLTHATGAAADHVHAHAESGGLLGAHPGRSFFAAFAAGLIKGDGVIGALEDGAAGVVTAKITEVLCEKMDMDPTVAATVAAAATPYIMGYLREHLGH